jgi:TRAP-type C4-dicarboxylate transport system substrate-binding protein
VDNYKTISSKLTSLTPFKGNTLTAFWDGDTYKVFSYSTLIAHAKQIGVVSINANKYSVTTSKHQNIIRRAWGLI